MTAAPALSVFIIALNEADRIADTIESVRGWVDEVIVIDSGSDDETVSVAEKLGAKVIHNAWPGYGLQKRFGEDQCRSDWVLNLDADEMVSAALKQEILQAMPITTHSGFMINIVEILPGRKEPGAGAHVTRAVRLYRKSCGRYSDSTVHDRVQMHSGTVGELVHIVEHRSSRGLTHSLDKINRYSTMQAEDMKNKGLTLPYLRLAVEFPIAFLKAYILRGYALKGTQGFTNAMIYAFSRFIRIAKYLELKRRG
jgi:glycosyltransferase involved in cell wall biosynthesis